MTGGGPRERHGVLSSYMLKEADGFHPKGSLTSVILLIVFTINNKENFIQEKFILRGENSCIKEFKDTYLFMLF